MAVIQGRFDHGTQGLFQGNAFGVQGQVISSNLAGNITGRSIGVEGEIYSDLVQLYPFGQRLSDLTQVLISEVVQQVEQK